MKFILIILLLLLFSKEYYAQNSDFMERFFSNHKIIIKDSLHHKTLSKHISKYYSSAFREVVDSFVYEKRSGWEFDISVGIHTKPCVIVLLDSGIYLYVITRLTSYYDKPQYQDTTFIAKIYDHNTNATIHNFDITKLNKQKVFTSISFEGDTIKYYINASMKGKVLEDEGDCPYPYECLESCCLSFIFRNRKLEYLGKVRYIGYGKINKKEFFFKKIRHIRKSKPRSP